MVLRFDDGKNKSPVTSNYVKSGIKNGSLTKLSYILVARQTDISVAYLKVLSVELSGV